MIGVFEGKREFIGVKEALLFRNRRKRAHGVPGADHSARGGSIRR
jgi:hypothetical protein